MNDRTGQGSRDALDPLDPRDHELAAEAMGVNLTLTKTQAFAVSAAFTSSLAERVAASEMAEMADVSSLLIRWVYSRYSSHSSGEGRFDDENLFNWPIIHLAKTDALNTTAS